MLLIGIIWLHMTIGLHYWLRLKRWYPAALPYLYLAAALLPVLALLGLLRAGLTIAAERGLARLGREACSRPSRTRIRRSRALELWAYAILAGLLLATLVARQIRRAIRNQYGSFRLSLESGRRVAAPVGVTMLEAIRGAGIPHASVCGGRGRCTTCRVRVSGGLDTLPLPNETEKRALSRIDAPRNVRLACQTRPRRDLSIVPLLPPTASAQTARRLGAVQGSERTITVMFLDLRGSTALGERLLPYDTVFLLNRFFAEMSAALKETGGHYAQFNGDGLMALYGLEFGVEQGCRDALAGAAAMFRRLGALNEGMAGGDGRAAPHGHRHPYRRGDRRHHGAAGRADAHRGRRHGQRRRAARIRDTRSSNAGWSYRKRRRMAAGATSRITPATPRRCAAATSRCRSTPSMTSRRLRRKRRSGTVRSPHAEPVEA